MRATSCIFHRALLTTRAQLFESLGSVPATQRNLPLLLDEGRRRVALLIGDLNRRGFAAAAAGTLGHAGPRAAGYDRRLHDPTRSLGGIGSELSGVAVLHRYQRERFIERLD